MSQTEEAGKDGILKSSDNYWRKRTLTPIQQTLYTPLKIRQNENTNCKIQNTNILKYKIQKYVKIHLSNFCRKRTLTHIQWTLNVHDTQECDKIQNENTNTHITKYKVQSMAEFKIQIRCNRALSFIRLSNLQTQATWDNLQRRWCVTNYELRCMDCKNTCLSKKNCSIIMICRRPLQQQLQSA